MSEESDSLSDQAADHEVESYRKNYAPARTMSASEAAVRRENAKLRAALEKIRIRAGQHAGIDATGAEIDCYEIAKDALKS